VARRRVPPRRSGFLNIDKPPGWTSHDVVARVRRITGERQVGHAGTLDPAASGVLPVAVGHATKVLSFIEDADKAYVATIRFGVTTDSADRDGRLIATRDASGVTSQAIVSSLAAFRGEIDQAPPMHSAIKVGGRRLYDLARSGVEVDVATRQVTIHELVLVDWTPPDAIIRVVCSKGTYIRSLARDIGESVGPGAMLASLVRTRAGQFRLASSIPLAGLESSLECHGWRWIALHPDAVLGDTGIAILDAEGERRWFHGLPVPWRGAGDVVRVYDSGREWVGIATVEEGTGALQPRRVIRGSVE
jgi:tRNA pseudouridine55 synthase